MGELRLMKGNEALAEALIRAGTDAYFGYPITPQSEVMEYLMTEKPYETTGMVVLQVESEIAAINMVYGAAGCGKKAVTTSSSPGISLMQEGLSYLAGAELPCLLVNVVRGGPGLGTIQPSQADYFQSTRGGGHGDYRVITLAPNSVQEMYDHVQIGFDLAFKYRNPVMILSDGAIGQMMEKIELGEQRPRSNGQYDWATTGKKADKNKNTITSLFIKTEDQEAFNIKLVDKYKACEAEVIYEETYCEDADYILVAFGTSARICQKSVQIARARGIKAGLFRPVTVFPFPSERLAGWAAKVKGFLTVEMNAGQMVEDVRLCVNGKKSVEYYGRLGGVIPTPTEIVDALEKKFL